MPDYSIYILPESLMTISGGEQLDGVTQGDGSHLVGESITLNDNAWQEVLISDTGDSDFEDNDGNQTLNGAQTIDGVSYADGTRVEAEYALTVTDGTNTYTVIAFNVRNSSPAFGTVEGLAFIGPPAGFPPIGVPLTVISNQEGPSNPADGHASPPCFVAGTRIKTPGGEVPVEALCVGDLVTTRDEGPQPIRWIGRGAFSARGSCAPIRFEAGVLGNSRPLRVSPQHRMLLTGWSAELHFGQAEVLVPAKAFIGSAGVSVEHGERVEYFHLLFDAHQIVISDGALSESFSPGAQALSGLDTGTRRELLEFFPDLVQQDYPDIATSVKPAEAPVVCLPA